MNDKRPGISYVRDADTILTILALGIEIVHTYREGESVYFGFCQEDVAPILADWYSNRAIPLRDARNYIIAKSIFRTVINATR